MGKGNRNRDNRGYAAIDTPTKRKSQAPRAKKQMPGWLKKTISIAVVVVLVLGIVAGILASNGTFKRWQVLVKSTTGQFTVNRQVATFLAWELEYYYAYMSWLNTYYTDSSNDLFQTYTDPDDYAFDRATTAIRSDVYDSNGNLVSTPRDIVDDAMSLLINHVAVSDYAYNQGIRLGADEWKGNLTITWYSGYEDTLPVTWTDLKAMQYEYGYNSLDLLLKQIFGTGMKEKDVKAAMELVCMYEKYLALKTAEVEAGTTPTDVADYVKNNPSYFYTTDYLTYQTKDAALKAKLEGAADVKQFKEFIVDNWFEAEGNYKEIFNLYVTGEKAEKDYVTVEGKTGDALKEALEAINAEKVTYLKADASNEAKIPAELSKWLFDATREAGQTKLLVAGESFYLVAFESKNYNEADQTLTSVTVSVKKYDYVDGEALGEDTAFKDNVWAQLLINLELSDAEAPVVNYLKAKDKADQFLADCEKLVVEKALAALDTNKVGSVTRVENGTANDESVPEEIRKAVFPESGKLAVGSVVTANGTDLFLICVEAYNEEDDSKITYSYAQIDSNKKDEILNKLAADTLAAKLEKLKATASSEVVRIEKGTATNEDVDDAILSAIYDVQTKHPVGTVLTVEMSGAVQYLICIEAYDAEDDTKITYSYAELDGDAYYMILNELEITIEKDVIPADAAAAYTTTAADGSYQKWMFDGATAENGYQSPVAENDIKVITSTKTETNEEVTIYDLYIIVRPLHLDDEMLVNGGYYVFPDTATKTVEEYLEELKTKTGDELIAALQKIGVTSSSSSTNNATVSETIFREDLDEKLGDWLFADEREANDVAAVKGSDGKTYIAVYLSDTVTWKIMGESYYVADVVNKWMTELASHYTVNQRTLNRFGEPAPVTTTTTAA